MQERNLQKDHFSVSLGEIRGMIAYQSQFSAPKFYIRIFAVVLRESQYAMASRLFRDLLGHSGCFD